MGLNKKEAHCLCDVFEKNRGNDAREVDFLQLLRSWFIGKRCDKDTCELMNSESVASNHARTRAQKWIAVCDSCVDIFWCEVDVEVMHHRVSNEQFRPCRSLSEDKVVMKWRELKNVDIFK